MLNENAVLNCIKEYCNEWRVDYDKAFQQLRAIGSSEAVLCVANPNAPQADGLKNDIATLMLPTLYVRMIKGELVAVETEYTAEYLKE